MSLFSIVTRYQFPSVLASLITRSGPVDKQRPATGLVGPPCRVSDASFCERWGQEVQHVALQSQTAPPGPPLSGQRLDHRLPLNVSVGQ